MIILFSGLYTHATVFIDIYTNIDMYIIIFTYNTICVCL